MPGNGRQQSLEITESIYCPNVHLKGPNQFVTPMDVYPSA